MPIPAGSTVRYVTPQQVREVLAPDGEDPDGSTAASMDDAALETAITEAADEVDAALVGRYTVPFPVAPSLVQTVTRDLAAYGAELTFRRGDPLPRDHPVALRYARAVANVTGLSKGTLTLDVATAPSSGGAVVVNPYEGQMFGLEDFALQQGPPSGQPVYFPSGSEWR